MIYLINQFFGRNLTYSIIFDYLFTFLGYFMLFFIIGIKIEDILDDFGFYDKNS